MFLIFKENDRYYKRSFAKQCEYSFMSKKCQGAENHEGEHWRYDDKGWYQSSNKGYIQHSPPSSDDYVNPIDRMENYFMNFSKEEEITFEEFKKLGLGVHFD